jgi:glyoxylase-like metal-dependent hydrolase (beta-lactamase superfamily II)/rhodanese-related sulfurtransferase
MQETPTIDVSTLEDWLERGKEVTVLDIRQKDQREEWQIPGSIYADAYTRLRQGDYSVMDEISLPENVPVVAVCAAGNTSKIAARELRKKGLEAYSLEQGMKGWSLAWNQATISFESYQIVQLRRTGKGCLSYIIASNSEAIAIDASLPIEVYENILRKNKWKLKSVLETHIHADHLSRSKQLSDHSGVPLQLPVPNKVAFDYDKIEHDQIINIGNIGMKVIATPGHTLESVCFLVNNEILFTGDTVFTNAVGRPDLKASDEETRKRAGLLFDSLHKLMGLNDTTIVLPAHASEPIAFDKKPVKATVSEIKNKISVLQLAKDEFVKTILSKLPDTPNNYLAIVERNLSGNMSDINPIDLEAGANRCAVP